MHDRVVIMTGGGTGIGRAAALQCAQAEASSVVVGRRATP
jgi:NAD(P)-dependent dehydrogenase (short-subunit alcohol dehydrogenase family)